MICHCTFLSQTWSYLGLHPQRFEAYRHISKHIATINKQEMQKHQRWRSRLYNNNICRLLLKAGWWHLARVSTLLAPGISRPGRVMWLASRQCDGDAKTPCFGSKTCFLRWFHNRSEAYFGQKSAEHVKIFNKRNMEFKKQWFLIKICLQKKCFSWICPALLEPGPGRYGPIWARKIPPNT